MVCDVTDPVTKQRYDRDPRYIARKAEMYLSSTGLADTAYFGAEAEFFIFDNVRFDQREQHGFYFIDAEEGRWNSCFLESRRRHTRFDCDWSSDVCSSDLCRRCSSAAARASRPCSFPRRRWWSCSSSEDPPPLLPSKNRPARKCGRPARSRIPARFRPDRKSVV